MHCIGSPSFRFAARGPLRVTLRRHAYPVALNLIPQSMAPRSIALTRSLHATPRDIYLRPRSLLSKPPCKESCTNKTIAFAYCFFVTGCVAFVVKEKKNFLNKRESFQYPVRL